MGGQRPRQADLRRAVSTACHALFHALCRTCSDCFVGATTAARSTRAWQQVYRGVDHNHAKKQFQNTRTLNRFPPDIQTFANEFVRCQIERHRADYDPFQRYGRQQVLDLIDDAETALPEPARRAVDRPPRVRGLGNPQEPNVGAGSLHARKSARRLTDRLAGERRPGAPHG